MILWPASHASAAAANVTLSQARAESVRVKIRLPRDCCGYRSVHTRKNKSLQYSLHSIPTHSSVLVMCLSGGYPYASGQAASSTRNGCFVPSVVNSAAATRMHMWLQAGTKLHARQTHNCFWSTCIRSIYHRQMPPTRDNPELPTPKHRTYQQEPDCINRGYGNCNPCRAKPSRVKPGPPTAALACTGFPASKRANQDPWCICALHLAGIYMT